mmetsp:Transcript_41974/g.80294  ORF Transcript_41974/g.80294 Transcript_41974/m.80294 type:complete len:300 (+) Transcript_41974:1798-2697(+)
MRQVAGVACRIVAWLLWRSAASCMGQPASSRRASTHLAPLTRGRNSSSPAMSKHTVVTATSASLEPTPRVSWKLARKFTMDWWQICTPLGLPVDPEVKMTYILWAAACATSPPLGLEVGDAAASAAASSGASNCRSRGCTFSGRCRDSARSEVVITTAAAASSSIIVMRSLGYSGSRGTYAAPHLSTARRETGRSGVLSKKTPTSDPAPTPMLCRWLARRLARASISAYVMPGASVNSRATASGQAFACFSNSWCTPPGGMARLVSLHFCTSLCSFSCRKLILDTGASQLPAMSFRICT